MKNKFSFGRKKKSLISAVIMVWLTISVFLSNSHEKQISSLIFDLPQNMKQVSPFLLSLLYLDLFVPGLLLVIGLFCYLMAITFKERILNSQKGFAKYYLSRT